MKRSIMAVFMILLLAGPAMAAKYDLIFPSTLTDASFKDFVREGGAVAAYRGIAPADPEGLTGFDLGVGASFVDINSSVWNPIVKNGSAPSYLAVPSIHLRKGLPFNFDVGAAYSQIPNSNIKLIGAEVQWALLEGGVAEPAVALRGSYSKLLGVGDFDLHTLALDGVVSKGFAFFTPYVGVGLVRISGSYTGDDPTLKSVLNSHDFTEPRYFAGLQTSLGLVRLTLDAEYLKRPIYTAKVSLGW
jgi:hypothetical protein